MLLRWALARGTAVIPKTVGHLACVSVCLCVCVSVCLCVCVSVSAVSVSVSFSRWGSPPARPALALHRDPAARTRKDGKGNESKRGKKENKKTGAGWSESRRRRGEERGVCWRRRGGGEGG